MRELSRFALLATVIMICCTNLVAQEKILQGKTLWTLFDSLGDTNDWQNRFSELSGCTFYPKLNRRHLSYGGTNSAPQTMNGTLGRAKLLVALKDSLPIDIVMISNTNDIAFADPEKGVEGSIEDRPWMQGSKRTVHKGCFASEDDARAYGKKNLRKILRSSPVDSRAAGNMLVFPYFNPGHIGNRIEVVKPSAKGGDVNFQIGRNRLKVNVPGGMDSERTRIWLASQFYGAGWTAVDNGDDSFTISYCYDKDNKVSVDPLDTGLELIVSETPEVKEYILFFTGRDASDWKDVGCWTEHVSLWSCYKGLMEYLQSNLPDARIFWFFPSYYNFDFDAPEFLDQDGKIDKEAYSRSEKYLRWRKLSEMQREIAARYGAGILDIGKLSGISLDNIREYYKPKDPHPLKAGYDRWASTLYEIFKSGNRECSK